MDEIKGVWRTVSGRRIFIREGQSLTDAMRESGKFGEGERFKSIRLDKLESWYVRKIISENYYVYYGKRFCSISLNDINTGVVCKYVFINNGLNKYKFIDKIRIDDEFDEEYKI